MTMLDKIKTILVTGSDGFIGNHLVVQLRKLGHTVLLADQRSGVDLCNPAIVSNLPDVDIVFHAAAFNGTKYFYSNPYDVITNNVLPTQYLMERYKGKCEHFVLTGTCESYAGAVDMFGYNVPTDENVPLVVTDVMNPRWSYGGSKIVSELLCSAAYTQFGQPFTIIRYHNIYGPRQINHFIPEFAERLVKGYTELYGYNNTRSFFYIDDAIDATIKLLHDPVNGPINIGSEEETTILEVALIIRDYLGINKELTLHSAPVGSVTRRCPDISLLKQRIDYQQTIKLNTGIKITLDSILCV